MSRSPTECLKDMLDACFILQSFAKEVTTPDALEDDIKLKSAIERQIEILGEAAKHIPPAMQQQIPGLAWDRMIAMRNVLAHGYFGIQADVLVTVTLHKIEEIITPIQSYLVEHPEKPS